MSINPPKNIESGSSCVDCKHFKTFHADKSIIIHDFINCIAFPFPDGIPDEIYNNGHDKPRPDLGQGNDIVFELNKED